MLIGLRKGGIMYLKPIIILCVVVLTACTHTGSIYNNLYDGLSLREALVHPSAEAKLSEQSIGYHRYAYERDKLLHRNDNK